MTRPNREAPKGRFPANDNFQELTTNFPEHGRREIGSFHRESAEAGQPAHLRQDGQPPSMVSGTAWVEHHRQGEQSFEITPRRDPYANWTAKGRIGRRKVTRSLTLPQVKDLQSGWLHANTIGLPINRFVTFRPSDINEQNPEQRIQTWTMWRNKLAQFARDHGFDFTCLWTRESQRHTALNEHLHVLMHVPPHLHRRFDKVVRAWCNGSDEIDVRPCTYQTRQNGKGGHKNVLTYVTKNSPQAGRFLQRTIQLGGPIFGKRYGLSRNLTARARSRHEVRGGLRRELRLLPASEFGVAGPVPTPANDGGSPRDGRSAA